MSGEEGLTPVSHARLREFEGAADAALPAEWLTPLTAICAGFETPSSPPVLAITFQVIRLGDALASDEGAAEVLLSCVGAYKDALDASLGGTQVAARSLRKREKSNAVRQAANKPRRRTSVAPKAPKKSKK